MTEEPPLPPQPMPTTKRHIVVLTGMSGAGLSTALKVFEDMGYEAVDNLRLTLVPALIDDDAISGRHLAVAIDTRNATFAVEDLLRTVRALAERGDFEVRFLFLECSDDALQQRFTETRRRHPLAVDRPVTDGIKREREMLWPLKNEADQVIDTSQTSIHDLRRMIAGEYRYDHSLGLTLFVTSFSYRHGVPREADLVFDARFLANPHWDPALRPLTGRDEAVAAYIQNDPDYPAFIEHLTALLLPLLPRYQQEGKSYLTVAVGCTGGRHRSVFVAEELVNVLASHGFVTGVGHRDLDRNAGKAQ
ncbi:MAG: RNase adapter RapZ [Alphaproteobacteria bacterium]|nr:RNase adapter RapZ [Alphaproteobacteria bacterium]